MIIHLQPCQTLLNHLVSGTYSVDFNIIMILENKVIEWPKMIVPKDRQE